MMMRSLPVPSAGTGIRSGSRVKPARCNRRKTARLRKIMSLSRMRLGRCQAIIDADHRAAFGRESLGKVRPRGSAPKRPSGTMRPYVHGPATRRRRSPRTNHIQLWMRTRRRKGENLDFDVHQYPRLGSGPGCSRRLKPIETPAMVITVCSPGSAYPASTVYMLPGILSALPSGLINVCCPSVSDAAVEAQP